MSWIEELKCNMLRFLFTNNLLDYIAYIKQPAAVYRNNRQESKSTAKTS